MQIDELWRESCEKVFTDEITGVLRYSLAYMMHCLI